MKESYSKKRRDVGTDARLKNQYKIIQFIKDSPAKSILLGITGAIFLKNVLSPDHSSRELAANKEAEPKPANRQADSQTAAEQEARNQFQAAIHLEAQPAATVADQLRGLQSLLTDGLPKASAGVLQMPQDIAALNPARSAPASTRSSLVAASTAGPDAELTVRLSDGPTAGVGGQDVAEIQLRDPSGPAPDTLPAEASADWMDTLLGLLGLFAGRSALTSSGSATAQTVGGFVIDGYISGATVYRDDGTGKPLGGITQTTDASGHYGALPDGPGKIVVVATSSSIDQSTGKAFTTALTLYAPGNASVINPITTLIQNSVEQGKTLAEATSAVVKGLGLGAGIDYLNFDPISTFASASGTAQSDAFKVQLAATQIANLMITGAAAISMASGSDSATASKAVLDKLASVVSASTVALDLSQESSLNTVFSGLNVSASAVSLIASANSVVGNTLQDLYDVQSIIQGAVLEVSGTNAETAFRALNTLVSMVNNPDPASRQQVLQVSLASTMDVGANANSHISFDATPVFRVDLSNLIAKKSVAVGDLVILNDTVDAVSASHAITASDLAQGYADMALSQLPVRQGILISAQIFSQSSEKIYAKGFTSISKSTPSVTQDVDVDATAHLTATGKLAALAASGGVVAASDNLGALTLANDGSYTYRVSNKLAQALTEGEVHIDTFTVTLGSASSASTKTLSFSVAGKDDAAVIGLPTVSGVTDNVGVSSLTATGTLSIVDPDHQQAAFQTTVKAAAGNLGVLTLAADGSYSYRVDESKVQALIDGDTVIDTFTVTSLDGTRQAINFSIFGQNSAPFVTAGLLSVTEDRDVVTFDALQGARDVDRGAILQAVVDVASLPAGLSYNSAAHTFSFDPSHAAYQSLGAGQIQDVQVNYRISDGTLSTATSLTFKVTGTNDVASVSSATMALSEGDTASALSTSGTLTLTDPDTGQAQVTAQQVVGTYGTFQVNADGQWTYTANAAHDELTAGQKVSDSMTVTSLDGTATGTVKVNLTGTNDAPRVVAGAATAQEDGALVTFHALTGATDPEGASLSVVNLPSSLPDGVSYDAASKTFSLNPGHASYQSLGLGETTTLTISYGVSDGVVSTPTTLTFTVQGANDAATISDALTTDVTDTATATTLTASGTLTVSDADQGQSSLQTTVNSAISNLGSLTVQANGNYVYSVAENRVQSLAAGATQIDTFTIQSLDGTTKVLSFTIHGTNDAPVVAALASAGAEGSASVTIDALSAASDADVGSVLRVVNLPATLPAGVSYDATTHRFTINPAVSAYDALAVGQSATLTLNYGVSDGTATTSQKLTFTITGTNDAPVVGSVAASATEAGASVTLDALTNASDVDTGNLLSVVNLPATLPAGVSYNAATHSFTIDPSVSQYDSLAAGQSALVTVSYGVSDGTAITPQTLTFTVNGSNDSASIGTPSVADVTEDTSVNALGNLTAVGTISISDVDQGQSSFSTVVTAAAGNLGALSLQANGVYTYTVANSATQSLGGGVTKLDTFTITSADGTSQDVSFTVHGTNDAPTVRLGSTTAIEDGALVVFDALLDAGDVDASTALTAVVDMASLPAGVNYNSSNHSFSLNPQATVFQTLKQGETRDVVVSYGISDGVVTTPTQVTFRVTGTNDVAIDSSPTVDMSVQSKNDPDNADHTLPLPAQTLSGQLVIQDADADQSLFGQAWLGSGAPTGALSLANAATRTFATTYGTFSIQANGAWTFVTNDAFQFLTSSNSFTDVLSVSSLDGTATSKITVHVDVTGDLPSVSTSIFQTSQALSTSGRLIATDSLASNLQVGTLIGTYGQLSVTSDGHWTYQASNTYQSLPLGGKKTDTFTLKNADAVPKDIGTVIVNIVGTNEAPVVTASTATAVEDAALLVTVDALAHATDADVAFNGVATGTTLSVVLPTALPDGVIYDAATHSFVLNPADAAYQYLAAGQTTTVTVAYGVSDGIATTPTTLTFTVTGVNDVAVVSSAVVEKTEGNAASDLSASGKLSISDADAGQAYVVAQTVQGTYGAFAIDVNGNWTYIGNGAHNELAAGQKVSDNMTVTSQDGSVTQTITVNITGTNDAPVVGVVATTATEAGSTVTLDALSTASDVDTGSTLSVVNVPNPLPAGVSYNAGTHSFTIDPSVAAYDSLAAGQTATVTVSYGVSDGTAITAQTATFTVNGTNDAPVVGTVAVTATEAGAVVTVDALSTATDVDTGAVLRVVNLPTTLPAGVSYDVISHSLSIDPTVAQYDTLAAGQHATVTVTYGVSDGVTTTPQTATFTINGTNDAPLVTAAVAAATEDGATVVFNALAGASDVDLGNALSVVLPSTLPAGVSYDASTRSFSLNPANAVFQPLAQGATTQVVVNYGVSDGTVTTPNTWTVTVTGVNDAATVSSYSESKTETNAAADLSTSGHITVTDVDTGQALAVARRDVAGSYGTFAIKTNGDWTYIASSAHNELTAGQQVFDQFTVTSADGTATGTVRINITGTNDAPVLSSSNPTSVDIMQGQAATANLMQIKASDADGPDSGIVFEFAEHQTGDADYSQFTIDSKTGQISMLATGAQAVAADSTVTDYLFHVQAHDALGAISQTQTVDVHVNMAVHSDNTATLPGGIGDWDIAPVTKDQAGTTVSDGFLLISHADPLITIHLPANVNKLTFDGGGILRLSNDAGAALGHISDITEGSFAKHAINISPETTENTIIDILPNGDYTIVGASDSVFDKDLGTVDNYRRDVVNVDVNKSQSQFSLSADGQYVQMVLRDPTTNAITGTTLLRDIEAVQFKDATVLLAAGNGYLTAADAMANNDVSQSSAYIFEPLTSVYHPY